MVAASEGEAYENLTKAQLLAQFMYPNYSSAGEAKILSQAPLIRLKVMNLLQDRSAQEPDLSTAGRGNISEELYSSYGKSKNTDKGVLGFFSDITYSFNLENSDAGVFEKTVPSGDAGAKKNGTILPKTIDVAIGGFKPIHEQFLGWDERGLFAGGSAGALFPYGADHDSYKSEGNSYPDLDALQTAYNEDLQRKNEEAKAEAAIANAQARYGGMFGNMRRKRDMKRHDAGKLKGSKGRYISSTLAGQQEIDERNLAAAFEELGEGLDALDAAASEAFDGYVE